MATHMTKSIVKAFDLLEIVCCLPRNTPLRHVAAKSQMSLATTHRILTTLKRLGAIRLASDDRYELGCKLSELRAHDLAEAEEARAMLDDHMQALTRSHEMSSRTSILDEGGMLGFVAGADTAVDSTASSRRVGARFEAYFHAPGKLLLGHLDAGQLSDYIAQAPLVALTPKTITDPKRLFSEIRQAASVGYAVEREECVESEYAVAVPVRDAQGQAIAAVSVSRRLPFAQEMPRILNALSESAAAIAVDLDRTPRGAQTISWLAELCE